MPSATFTSATQVLLKYTQRFKYLLPAITSQYVDIYFTFETVFITLLHLSARWQTCLWPGISPVYIQFRTHYDAYSLEPDIDAMH